AQVRGISPYGTILSYDQPQGSLMTLYSASNVKIENLTLNYRHPAYNGVLVDQNRKAPTSTVPVFGDASYIRYVDCLFSSAAPGPPTPMTGAHCFLRLTGTICSSVENCVFMGAQYGIIGREPTAVASFSNAIEISGCIFAHIDQHGVYTPGQAWTIRNCTFEGDNQGRAIGISTDPAMGGAWGLQITGNWFGDVSASGKDWVTVFS